MFETVCFVRGQELPGQAIVQARNIGIIVGRNETIILSRWPISQNLSRNRTVNEIHRD